MLHHEALHFQYGCLPCVLELTIEFLSSVILPLQDEKASVDANIEMLGFCFVIQKYLVPAHAWAKLFYYHIKDLEENLARSGFFFPDGSGK